MAFALPGARTFGQVTRSSLIQAAAVLKVPARPAQRYIDDMLRAATAALPVLSRSGGSWRRTGSGQAVFWLVSPVLVMVLTWVVIRVRLPTRS